MVYNQGVITHIVLFKLADPADTDEAVERLRSLDGNVPALRSIAVGRNLVESPRAHDVGITATFDDLDGLAAYQADPFHRTVLDFITPRVERAASIDYES